MADTCISFKLRISDIREPCDSRSTVTEEDTQSSEIVSTLKQNEDTTTMMNNCLIIHTFLSKKPKSSNDVVQGHDETNDFLAPNSLTVDSISGSFDSDQTIQEFLGNHEVGLLSNLGSVKESSFSDTIYKEPKDFELGNDNKFLVKDVELGCFGKKQLLEEIEASVMAGDELRSGSQDELKVIDSDHTQAYDKKFLGNDNKFLENDAELGCRLEVGKKQLSEEIEASIAPVDSDHTQVNDNKFLGNDNKFLENDSELGCRLEAGKKQLSEEIEAPIVAVDSDHAQAYDNKFLENDVELGCRLEIGKKQLSGEIEASIAAVDSDHIQAYDNKLLGNDNELGSRLKVEIEASKIINGDPRCSLEIQVVDETALIGPLSVPKLGKKTDLVVQSKYTKSNKSGKEGIVAKKVKEGSHRRAKRGKRVLMKKGERSKMVYSREAMEALRFVNMLEQRKMWKDVHTGLGPLVRKEYDYLVSSKNQKNFFFNFVKKEEPTSVLGMASVRGRSNLVNGFVH